MDSQKWAVDIGAVAAEGMGNAVGVWATVLSPGFGTITWTSRWADLSALEKGFANLMGNAKYAELAATGAEFVNGPINDVLYEIVYEGSSGNDDARYGELGRRHRYRIDRRSQIAIPARLYGRGNRSDSAVAGSKDVSGLRVLRRCGRWIRR